jgi:tetratricopeptide (TPR) repeat protein
MAKSGHVNWYSRLSFGMRLQNGATGRATICRQNVRCVDRQCVHFYMTTPISSPRIISRPWNSRIQRRYLEGNQVASLETEDPRYIFVSYSHKDERSVYPQVEWLQSQAIDVWLDRGISPGGSWSDEIAEAIIGARLLVFLVTQNSSASKHCVAEINYALDNDVPVLVAFLKQTDLPGGLQLRIGTQQGILGYELSAEVFRQRLLTGIQKYVEHDVVSTAFTAGSHQFPKSGFGKLSLAQKLMGIAIVILIVMAGFLLLDKTPVSNTLPQAVTEQQPGAASEPKHPRIAILHFKNSIGVTDKRFADHFASELHIYLSTTKQIQLTSRIAAWAVSDNFQPQEISERLAVDYWVDGRVSTSGQRMKLFIELVESETGSVRWSNEYHTTAHQAMFLPQEMAFNILSELNITSGDRLNGEHSAPPTINQQAYADYLDGRDLLRKEHSASNLRAAESKLRSAVNLDPRFGLAYAALCDNYLRLYDSTSDSNEFENAETACHRALTLDRDSTEVHLALGNLYERSGQTNKAVSSFKQVLALSSADADAYIGLGYIYQNYGDQVLAENNFRRAVSVQPGYWKGFNALGLYEFSQGRFADAIENFTEVTLLSKDSAGAFNNIGVARLFLGEMEDAIQAWESANRISPGRAAVSNFGTANFLLGNYLEAISQYERAIEIAPEDHRLWGNLGDSAYFVTSTEKYRMAYQTATEKAVQSLSINPDDIQTISRLAVYLAGLGDGKGAQQRINQSLRLAPDDMYVLYNVAVATQHLGQPDQADLLFTKALTAGYPIAMLEPDPFFSAGFSVRE